MNRLYSLFLSRNPQFKGAVSVAGHSLGKNRLYSLFLSRNPQFKGAVSVAGHSLGKR